MIPFTYTWGQFNKSINPSQSISHVFSRSEKQIPPFSVCYVTFTLKNTSPVRVPSEDTSQLRGEMQDLQTYVKKLLPTTTNTKPFWIVLALSSSHMLNVSLRFPSYLPAVTCEPHLGEWAAHSTTWTTYLNRESCYAFCLTYDTSQSIYITLYTQQENAHFGPGPSNGQVFAGFVIS